MRWASQLNKGAANMEPISAIVTALVLGIVAALNEVSAQAVKDAYAGLKNLIQQKYSRVSITQLEDAPESKVEREAVQEALEKAGAEHDEGLVGNAPPALQTT
jgi:hypothetical protein